MGAILFKISRRVALFIFLFKQLALLAPGYARLFQISMTAYGIVAGMFMAALKASNGERYRYPITIRVVK